MFLYSGENTQGPWLEWRTKESFFKLSTICYNVDRKKKSQKITNAETIWTKRWNAQKTLLPHVWCVIPVNITPEYYLAGLLREGVVKLERKSEGSEQVTRAKEDIICLVLGRGAQIEKYIQRTGFCPCLLTHATETVNLWVWHARAPSRALQVSACQKSCCTAQQFCQLTVRLLPVTCETATCAETGGLQTSQLHLWVPCKSHGT